MKKLQYTTNDPAASTDYLAGMDRFRRLSAESAAGISLVPATSRARWLHGLHPRRYRCSGVYLLAHG